MPNTSMRCAIGARLKHARLQAGMTQEAVATDFQCTRQAVSSWERGSTMPTVLELRELASLYVVSADQLLFGVSDLAQSREDALDLFKALGPERQRDFADTQI